MKQTHVLLPQPTTANWANTVTCNLSWVAKTCMNMSRLLAYTSHPVNNHYNSNPDTFWTNHVHMHRKHKALFHTTSHPTVHKHSKNRQSKGHLATDTKQYATNFYICKNTSDSSNHRHNFCLMFCVFTLMYLVHLCKQLSSSRYFLKNSLWMYICVVNYTYSHAQRRTPNPRNSEVLTKLSQIPSSVENTSVTT
jgi:hypothetical protein